MWLFLTFAYVPRDQRFTKNSFQTLSVMKVPLQDTESISKLIRPRMGITFVVRTGVEKRMLTITLWI